MAQPDMSRRAADGSRGVLEETMASTRVAEKQPVPLGQWHSKDCCTLASGKERLPGHTTLSFAKVSVLNHLSNGISRYSHGFKVCIQL